MLPSGGQRNELMIAIAWSQPRNFLVPFVKSIRCPTFAMKRKRERKEPYNSDTKTSKYFKEAIKSQPAGEQSTKLARSFYDKPCLELAKSLLGQTLVRILDNGDRVSGKIVETEGYLGAEDKASHSFAGRKTKRNAAMFMTPGTSYVYMTYGIYHCFNITSQGNGAAVLLRALEPLESLHYMQQQRGKKKKDGGKNLKDKDLCSGPSKLCQSLNIDKEMDQKDLSSCPNFWLEKNDGVSSENIVISTRIGIDGAGKEHAEKPFRFYVKGNEHVSKRDKKAEQKMESM